MLAMVIGDKKWEEMPTEVREYIQTQAQTSVERDSGKTRKSDDKSIQKLLSRGYTMTKFDDKGKAEYEAMSATVRKRLTGRIYPKELVDRVVAIASGK